MCQIKSPIREGIKLMTQRVTTSTRIYKAKFQWKQDLKFSTRNIFRPLIILINWKIALKAIKHNEFQI